MQNGKTGGSLVLPLTKEKIMKKFEVRKVEKVVPCTNNLIETYEVAVHHDDNFALASFAEHHLRNVHLSFLVWKNKKTNNSWKTFYDLVREYVSVFAGKSFSQSNATEQIDTATQMIAGSWDADKVGYILTSKEVA